MGTALICWLLPQACLSLGLACISLGYIYKSKVTQQDNMRLRPSDSFLLHQEGEVTPSLSPAHPLQLSNTRGYPTRPFSLAPRPHAFSSDQEQNKGNLFCSEFA